MKFRYAFLMLVVTIIALIIAVNNVAWQTQPVRPQQVRDTSNKAGISFYGLSKEDSMKWVP